MPQMISVKKRKGAETAPFFFTLLIYKTTLAY